MIELSPPWSEFASCVREDPELFFPISEDGPGSEQVAKAKAICRECPVLVDCLEFALKTGQPAGVWGGKTPEERRALGSARVYL